MAETDEQQPDGYYSEDDVSAEELDLSFLDEDETEPKKPQQK